MRHALMGTLIALVALPACNKDDGAKAAQADATYTVRAVVENELKAGITNVNLRHEAIEDFVDRKGKKAGMPSMSMPMALSRGVSTDGVAKGDKVEVTFEVHWKQKPTLRITKLARLPADTALKLGGDHVHGSGSGGGSGEHQGGGGGEGNSGGKADTHTRGGGPSGHGSGTGGASGGGDAKKAGDKDGVGAHGGKVGGGKGGHGSDGGGVGAGGGESEHRGGQGGGKGGHGSQGGGKAAGGGEQDQRAAADTGKPATPK